MDFSAYGLADPLPFIAVGFVAQMIDGALGMAFGVISSTLLVSLGVPPAIASARVHTVETFTAAVSGISHVLHQNVDWWLFARPAIPGMIGGVAAAPLGSFAAKYISRRPLLTMVGAVLMLTSLYGLYRALSRGSGRDRR